MSDRRRYTPEQRRSQLVKVAIETFADKGIERAGHGDIAKRAGVSTATVFNYFPTKDALTLDVLKEIEAQLSKFTSVGRFLLIPIFVRNIWTCMSVFWAQLSIIYPTV